MKRKPFLLGGALALFMALCVGAQAAREGALRGLELCRSLLIPSLLPFFAAAGLLNRLGLAELLARRLGGCCTALFGVSGAGAGAFVLGLCGGYPLGAAAVSELWRGGAVSRREAERLLGFCDNTGPAFAVAALGAGAFGSVGAGLALYAVHAASAVLTGRILRPRTPDAALPPRRRAPSPAPPVSAGAALTQSVLAAAQAMVNVCAFVVVFSALLALLESGGALDALTAALARATHAPPPWCRALLYSLLELSSAVGLLSGLPVTPLNLALAAFALGWGGLCVHGQAAGAAQGLSLSRHFAGKALHGLLSAAVMYIMSTIYLALSRL